MSGIHWQFGVVSNQATSGGGGGGGVTPAITIATSATGNFNNAVKLAVFNINTAAYDGTSTGIFDGSTSTFGTASSPTRTTQNQNISATDLRDNAYFAGTGNLQAADAFFVVGCYIRHNGTTASNFQIRVNAVSNGLVSSSVSNSQVVMQQNVLTYANQQDTTTFATGFNSQSGMYNLYSFPPSGSHYYANLQLQGKSGAVPQAGDTFTIRIDASATVDGTACTATHDLTITLT